jgi:hypothetical protein
MCFNTSVVIFFSALIITIDLFFVGIYPNTKYCLADSILSLLTGGFDCTVAQWAYSKTREDYRYNFAGEAKDCLVDLYCYYYCPHSNL